MGWRDAPVVEEAAETPRWARAPVAERAAPEPSWWGSLVESIRSGAKPLARGAGQGVTLGLGDEGAGALGAMYEAAPFLELLNPGRVALHLSTGRPYEELVRDTAERSVKNETRTLGDLYRVGRDQERRANAAAQQSSPNAYLAGELMGGAVVPIPGSGAAKPALTLGSKLRRGATLGALLGGGYGLGTSEADLTQGDVGGAALDTGLGAAFGAAGGTAAEGLAHGAAKIWNGLRNRASAGIRDAVEAETQKQTALTEKSIRSSQGEYRSAIQSASRDLEVLERAVQAMPDSEEGMKAAAFLASPEGRALRETVARGKLSTAPERIAEMEAKQTTLADLVAGKDEAIRMMTAEGLRDPVKKHVAPRLAYLAKNAAPLFITGAGGAIGGVEGATIGGTAALLYSLTRGSPGRTLSNMIKQPGVRKAFWEKVLATTGGASPTKTRVVQELEEALAKGGEQSFDLAVARLAESGPAANDILRAVAEMLREPETPAMETAQAARARFAY